jgi:hypothetical protein
MRKIYLKIYVGIIILLWIIYLIQTYFINYNKESFINSLFKPYIRKANENISF